MPRKSAPLDPGQSKNNATTFKEQGTERKRRTQKDRSDTMRRNLIDAAIRCYSTTGFQNATVEAVAEAAGASRGAIQHHFGGRGDLLLAVVDELGSKLSKVSGEVNGLTLEEKVSNMIDQMWSILREPHFIAVLEIWLACRNDPALSPAMYEQIAETERQMDNIWRELFQNGAATTEMIGALRHIAYSALRGLALRQLWRERKTTPDKELAILKDLVVLKIRSMSM